LLCLYTIWKLQTFCGVFRRQALDRGAAMLKVDHIVTGHNADDIAETVIMNSKPQKAAVSSFMKILV
jgi:tRNA(Ile)-lysidine synthase TilS/MesJ